ncbi:MAG: hypothetical protein MZU91_06840 [Desulfosudis oleivorans]|nr:hypothetical protein [Desulfosudis oleivorans]
MENSTRRHWPLLVALLLGPQRARGCFAEHATSPLWDFLRLDEAQYAQTAAEAAAGAILPDYIRTNAPGYAWFLAPLFAIFADLLPAARVLQMLLGLGAGALAYFLAWRLSASRRRGLRRGAVARPLLAPPRLRAATAERIACGVPQPCRADAGRAGRGRRRQPKELADEPPPRRPLLRPGRAGRPDHSGGGGGGYACPRAGPSPGLRRARMAPAALFLAAALLPAAPVVLIDRARSGEWFLLQTNGGLNFYIGNGPESDGTPWARPGGDWDELLSRPARAGVESDAAQDRWFARAALSAAADDPGRFVRLLGRKAVPQPEPPRGLRHHLPRVPPPTLRRHPAAAAGLRGHPRAGGRLHPGAAPTAGRARASALPRRLVARA